jgi:hypothetical protein
MAIFTTLAASICSEIGHPNTYNSGISQRSEPRAKGDAGGCGGGVWPRNLIHANSSPSRNCSGR